MRDSLDELLEKHYGADTYMRAYFQYAIPDMVTELKNVAKFHTLLIWWEKPVENLFEVMLMEQEKEEAATSLSCND